MVALCLQAQQPLLHLATGVPVSSNPRQQIMRIAGNYGGDLFGTLDMRFPGVPCGYGPCIWGFAAVIQMPIQFYPPSGKQVRILSIQGDTIAFIKNLGNERPIPIDTASGFLVGFQDTINGQSPYCNYCNSGTLLYLQDSITDKVPKTRIAYNVDYKDPAVLDSDNVLLVTLATFLNNTTRAIHLEVTYNIVFQFENIQ
jgi:hypothetical protein